MPSDFESVSKSPEHAKEELLKAIENASRVTVEIGTGNYPLFETKSVFDRDNLYIGVNVDPRQHDYLQQRIASTQGFAVLADFDEKKVETVPLPDRSADMVFMANVLGEPDSEHIMHDFKDEAGIYRGNSSIESKVQTLKESARVLKDGGYLVILENNTPYSQYAGKPYALTAELLMESGFEVVEALDQKDEGWEEAVAEFADPRLNKYWSFKSYLVIAKKANEAPVAILE